MWRILAGVAVVIVVVVVVILSVAAAVVVSPATDQPHHVDALVVPSGDHGERLSRALVLLHQGVAPVLVLVGEPDSTEDIDLCHGGQSFEVVCLRPQPDDTRQEARATARLAASRHWRTVAVVTSMPMVTRARLLFSRCFAGTTEVVGANLRFGGRPAFDARFHEVGGLLYAWFWARSC